MKYMGSKARFAKEIIPIIIKDRQENQTFVDLFTGGANIVSLIGGSRIANDKNKYLIAMFKGLQDKLEKPNEIPKELYNRARIEFNNNTNIEFSDFEIGWIGWMGSANGRFFDGGYSGKSITKIGTVRDYIRESMNNIGKQIEHLDGINFISLNYSDVLLPENSLIYCDIPYKGTKQYSTSKDFDYEKFYDWVRETSKNGHQIFISEYQMPSDFECVWSKEAKSSLSANGQIGGNKISTEKLFKYCG